MDLFFVLSGFLITGILLDARDSRTYFRAFYWRRLVRIFPLYYAYLIVVFLVLPPLLGGEVFPRSARNQWWFWTYLSNILLADSWLDRGTNHFWSLAIEEQFYLAWPGLIWILGRKRLLGFLVVLIPSVAILRAVLASQETSGQAIYLLTWTRLDSLAWGALVAVLGRSEGGLVRWRLAAWSVLLVSVQGLLWYALDHRGRHYAGHTPLASALMYSAIAAAAASTVVLLLTTPESRPARWFSRRTLRTIGKYSYGMYVFHVVIDSALRSFHLHPKDFYTREELHLPGFALYFAAFTGLTFLAAWLSWQLLEKRFLKLKGWVPYR